MRFLTLRGNKRIVLEKVQVKFWCSNIEPSYFLLKNVSEVAKIRDNFIYQFKLVYNLFTLKDLINEWKTDAFKCPVCITKHASLDFYIAFICQKENVNTYITAQKNEVFHYLIWSHLLKKSSMANLT